MTRDHFLHKVRSTCSYMTVNVVYSWRERVLFCLYIYIYNFVVLKLEFPSVRQVALARVVSDHYTILYNPVTVFLGGASSV